VGQVFDLRFTRRTLLSYSQLMGSGRQLISRHQKGPVSKAGPEL